VQVTTERILAGRLPEIPYQPRRPKAAVVPSVNLIDAYNLRNRLANKSEAQSADMVASDWSSDPKERQALLRKKQEAMILKAREKLLAKKSVAED